MIAGSSSICVKLCMVRYLPPQSGNFTTSMTDPTCRTVIMVHIVRSLRLPNFAFLAGDHLSKPPKRGLENPPFFNVFLSGFVSGCKPGDLCQGNVPALYQAPQARTNIHLERKSTTGGRRRVRIRMRLDFAQQSWAFAQGVWRINCRSPDAPI